MDCRRRRYSPCSRRCAGLCCMVIRFVELSVLLGVHEEGEVEEDGESQVEVRKEEGEVKEKRTMITMRMG